MDKPSKSIARKSAKQSGDKDYYEFVDMLESGMSDSEIAEEMGVAEDYVSKLKRETYGDYI